jgi:hypothetical protein
LKIARQRRRPEQRLAGLGMRESEMLRVKRLALERDRHGAVRRVIERVIRAIADQRHPFVRSLHADLVTASRLQLQPQLGYDARGRRSKFRQNFVMRDGLDCIWPRAIEDLLDAFVITELQPMSPCAAK